MKNTNASIVMSLLFAALLSVGSSVAHAQSHSVTLSGCLSLGASSYNFQRNGAKINSAPVPTCNYVDTTVSAGVTYTYTATGVNSAGESLPSAGVVAMVPVVDPPPPPPPPPAPFKVGDCIKLTADSNIRGSAPNNSLGTPLYGIQPANSTGCIPAGGITTARVPNFPTGGPVWIQVKFTAPCPAISKAPNVAPNCTGYVGSDHLTLTVIAPPPPPPQPSISQTVCTKSATAVTCVTPIANIPANSTYNNSASVSSIPGITRTTSITIP